MSQTSDERLNKYEISFYSIVWISVISYSVYEVFLARNDLLAIFGVIIESDGLAPGWKWIGGIRDVGDISWKICIGFLKQLIPWLLIQLLISQTLKHMKIHETLIYSLYIIYTGAFLWNYCGYDGLRFLLYTPCLMCYIKYFPDKRFMDFIILLVLNNWYFLDIDHLIRPMSSDPYKIVILKVAFDWTLLRSMSCHADGEYDEYRGNFLDVIKKLTRSMAYCWYLPTLFMGPYITYPAFIKSVEGPQERWTSRRMIVKLLNLMRFIFWMYFTEFIMHFVYAHAISIKPYAVMNLNTWAYYGLVFCLGQYFYLQYLVIYGITGEISRADNIEAPPPPKCIARIHLYSDMWRHFDRGLYEYLVRHIYKRVLNWKIPQRKIVATFLTFLYVWIFAPKIHKAAFITIILNFMCVVVESIAQSIGNSVMYAKLRERYISSRNNRRFNCFLATPLLLFSIAANLYTIHGNQFADHFLKTLLNESPAVIAFLMFALYCCSQVSTESKLIEKSRASADENTRIIDATHIQ